MNKSPLHQYHKRQTKTFKMILSCSAVFIKKNTCRQPKSPCRKDRQTGLCINRCIYMPCSRLFPLCMPICVVAVTDDGSAVLDFSGQKLTEMVPLVDARPVVLIYDKNHITGIANLEHCEHCLEQVGAVPVLRNAFL